MRDDRLLLVGQNRRGSILGDLCRAGVVDALPQLQQGNIAIVCHHVQVVPGQMHAPLNTRHLPDTPKGTEHQGEGRGRVRGAREGHSPFACVFQAVLIKFQCRANIGLLVSRPQNST